jgi:predicted phosphodiesterase
MWQVLGEKELAWLGEPPTSMVLNSGDKRVFVTHAAPSNHLFKYLTPETPDEEIAEELGIGGADIVIVGHSHRPFVRGVKGRLLVNVGSVGQPRDGIPKASYAILE